MTAPRRRYTRKEKADAVTAAMASSTLAASEAKGIPRKTIAYWMERPEFADLRQKTRAEHAEGFRVLAAMAMDRLVQLLPTMEPRDLTVLLGVATDKSQLLGGEATERTETRDISSNLDDHEREVLNDAIRGELARRSDERTAKPAVGAAGEAGAEGTPR